MKNSQLIKKGLGTGYNQIYPLADILGIIDLEHKLGNDHLLDTLIRYNHLYLPWKGGIIDTRNQVPALMRRKGFFITYLDSDGKLITEIFKDKVGVDYWSDNENWEVIPDLEFVQENASKIPNGAILPELLSPELQQLISLEKYITNLVDGEDLRTVNNVIKFNDKEYNSSLASGLGRVYLRKNWQLINGVTINNITQEMFTLSNTIYIIQYNYDLNNQTVVIPENCVLKFDGGMLCNGTILFNSTTILDCFLGFYNCILLGNVTNSTIEANWFKKIQDEFTNLYISIVNVANASNSNIILNKSRYIIGDGALNVVCQLNIDFDNSEIVLNITTLNFQLKFSNSSKENYSGSYDNVKNIINNRGTNFTDIKDSVIFVESSETEFLRNHLLVHTPTKKFEFTYIDKDGYIKNEFYNDSIDNITKILIMDCSNRLSIKNLNLVLDDNLNSPLTVDYRYIGILIYSSSNIEFKNVNLKCDILEYRSVYIRFVDCYNVNIKNLNINNTRLDSSVAIRDDYSSYCVTFYNVIKAHIEDVVVGATKSTAWTTFNGNYMTDFIYERCDIDIPNVHYRLNNAIHRNCNFTKKYTFSGYGNIIFENCTFSLFTGRCLLDCRSDYDSYFDGDIILNNITIDVTNENFNDTLFLFIASFSDFDFQSNCSRTKHKICNSLIANNIKISGNKSVRLMYMSCSKKEQTNPGEGTALFPKNIIIDGLKYDYFFYIGNLPTSSTYIFNPNLKCSININSYIKDSGNIKNFIAGSTETEDITEEEAVTNSNWYFDLDITINNLNNVQLYIKVPKITINLKDSIVTGLFASKLFSQELRYNLYNCLIKASNDNSLSTKPTYNFYNCTFDYDDSVESLTSNFLKNTIYKYSGQGTLFNMNNVNYVGCVLSDKLLTALGATNRFLVGSLNDASLISSKYIRITDSEYDITSAFNSYKYIELSSSLEEVTLNYTSLKSSFFYIIVNTTNTATKYNLKVDDDIIYTFKPSTFIHDCYIIRILEQKFVINKVTDNYYKNNKYISNLSNINQGLQLYNTTNHKLVYWDGTNWRSYNNQATFSFDENNAVALTTEDILVNDIIELYGTSTNSSQEVTLYIPPISDKRTFAIYVVHSCNKLTIKNSETDVTIATLGNPHLKLYYIRVYKSYMDICNRLNNSNYSDADAQLVGTKTNGDLVNFLGLPIGRLKGATSQRPEASVNLLGYIYYDTTIKKYICCDGENWTNMDGTSLS